MKQISMLIMVTNTNIYLALYKEHSNQNQQQNYTKSKQEEALKQTDHKLGIGERLVGA